MALLRERVLTSEQSDSIMSERTNQKRMQKLYELVPTWDVTKKYCLYKVLCATNPILTLAYTGKKCTLTIFPVVKKSRQGLGLSG